MKNFVQEGKTMTHTAAAEVLSGGVVVLPSGIGVAETTIALGAKGELLVEGVVELDKAAPLVINQGDKLYWDAGAKKLTKTAVGNTPAGIAHEGAVSAAPKVLCKLRLTPIGQAATQADSVAADVATLKADFNALLAKLKAAGLMANA